VRNSKGDWDAYSRASSTVSVTLSGNGQVSPDASNRRIVSRTVEGAEPTRQAISWLGIPAAFNLITSAHVAHRKPLRRHPGPLRTSRKAGPYRSQKRPCHPGRNHSGMVGDIERYQHSCCPFTPRLLARRRVSEMAMPENIVIKSIC
jgi:hypothetical protein